MAADALEQKERALQLIIRLDSVRDRLEDDGDPQATFQHIVNLLRETFRADAGAVLLVDHSTDEVEILAAVGTPDDIATTLCREAMQQGSIAPLANTIWKHVIGVPILLDQRNQLAGGIFLARDSRPFTAEEIGLLTLAESQIDSSVIQVRTIWKLAQRNRELEAIHQIDRLSDNTYGENELISGFTSIVQQHLHVRLCLIILSQPDHKQHTLRSMVDKYELPASVLEEISGACRDLPAQQLITPPAALAGQHLIAAPFIVSDQHLGTLVLGRDTPFTPPEQRLLFAMVSRMDSAIAKSRTDQKLAQRNRELETIYRIDHIRDQDVEFETMLQNVLIELCHAISSEMGYIMLYSTDQEKTLELRATTREGLLTQPEYLEIIRRISREALDTEKLICDNSPPQPLRSIIATPLILNERVIGVFGALNSSSPTGFSSEDQRMLSAITSQVDTAVFERLERRRMRRVLSRSVDPKVLDALLQRADDSLLAGERIELTTLFADLRSSTEWIERTEPEEIVSLLNIFLGSMTDVIFKHGGTLDKFVGDEIIALFGSPIPMQDHALHAARAALEMQAVHEQLCKELAAAGRELPSMGIGLSSGEVIAGEIGPPIRTDFTAIGRTMNLGARLCAAAVPGQILINTTTQEKLGSRARIQPLKPIAAKGIGSAVPVFELLSIGDGS